MNNLKYVDRNLLRLIFTNFNKLKSLTRVQPVLIDFALLRQAFGELQRRVISESPLTYEYRRLLTDPQLDMDQTMFNLMKAH